MIARAVFAVDTGKLVSDLTVIRAYKCILQQSETDVLHAKLAPPLHAGALTLALMFRTAK